ncbi:hypothetical protein TVAG_421390 [Trichomonas vaginalis G3]|uniref:Uncharacterized protein n=1 Tax=Trichomonas vaginalis (strain ATCC PRA-98 / G3) TaxID=412133 RepID=A2G6J5_TRIV3|nr:hypothetical protein TVAGG3_0879010 [Trichomonas vaginalis G3]EAX87228.1 hypothetical protein TVAG_421390 [Trichomonas vaginalis G3]KAI5501906.1 hypothetical protein TVAGG3_0879010 [Trichomonas vaginalis G3]|eukprot:XP_001300158.1 hypothetical protein [Trichomonas vaginalis G3]
MFFHPTGKNFPSDRKKFSFRQKKFFLPTGHKRMTDVPPTESIPKPEEPKAPAPAPQFQQFQSQSKLLPISTSRLLPISTTRLPELPSSSAYALLPQPLDVPAIPIPIQIEERPRVRRRSEPLTQRVCYSSN